MSIKVLKGLKFQEIDPPDSLLLAPMRKRTHTVKSFVRQWIFFWSGVWLWCMQAPL